MLGSGRGRFGARRQLLGWLDRLGALDVALRRRGRTAGASVPILAYHRVSDPDVCGPFDRGVIDCTPDAFDLQMATLSEHCSVIGVRPEVNRIGTLSRAALSRPISALAVPTLT